eukprot:SAG22_NODE_22283_length_229_cov_19.830769_1_plen_24_part_10
MDIFQIKEIRKGIRRGDFDKKVFL